MRVTLRTEDLERGVSVWRFVLSRNRYWALQRGGVLLIGVKVKWPALCEPKKAYGWGETTTKVSYTPALARFHINADPTVQSLTEILAVDRKAGESIDPDVFSKARFRTQKTRVLYRCDSDDFEFLTRFRDSFEHMVLFHPDQVFEIGKQKNPMIFVYANRYSPRPVAILASAQVR